MKRKNLGEVTPYLFSDYVIIAFKNDWLKIWNGIPQFSIIISDNGKLILEGPTINNSKQNVKEKCSDFQGEKDGI